MVLECSLWLGSAVSGVVVQFVAWGVVGGLGVQSVAWECSRWLGSVVGGF